MADGYDTVVGERGLTLSGGQRQRIALARAILADPAVLVLDDATSAVDAQTEEAIHEALRTVLSGRTTLLIAHRLSTLHLADRVVVLEGGRVTDEGTHDELLERSDYYRELVHGLDEIPVTDRIEELAAVTRAAWPDASPQTAPAARPITATLGAGLGGSSGAPGSWRLGLAPTPELLAQVAKLPAVRDTADLDLVREGRRDPQFGLLRLLRDFRAPLLLGLLFVVLDALAGLAGPVLVKTGVDNGVAKGAEGVLFAAAGVYLAHRAGRPA